MFGGGSFRMIGARLLGSPRRLAVGLCAFALAMKSKTAQSVSG